MSPRRPDPIKLEVFAIYENPPDYHGFFVVKRCVISKAGLVYDRKPFAVATSLRSARKELPSGLKRVPRGNLWEDPLALERWM